MGLMNDLASKDTPFIFIINYDATQAFVEPTATVDSGQCLYLFNGKGNGQGHEPMSEGARWQPEPPTYEEYAKAFATVRDNIMRGNSYLTNLTFRVPVITDMSLRDIYMAASAPYKLWLKDRLVCFSPEKFLQISHGRISSFPMKGTADASIPDAEAELMADKKEAAEHATIVDLIRNDLSIVASHVSVRRYRYVERLHTNRGDLLQTSSEVTGRLPYDYQSRMGDIIFSQLPAGSITGAPKRKTVEIIAEAETYRRGFYTGVMGLCSGATLDSAVMIRFVDIEDGQTFFKAGGGITSQSNCRSEYQELINKVYVPIR